LKAAILDIQLLIFEEKMRLSFSLYSGIDASYSNLH
jgi:hypothetical protein